MLTFNAERHEYRYAGKRVPSVTQALSHLVDLSFIRADVLENARQEGLAIHKTVELFAKNDLDEDDLPPWLVPRLDAFKKFMADTQFELEASESQVYHPQYGFAGTFDLKGRLKLKKAIARAVIDVKRSFAAGQVIGYQTAAYMAAVNAGGKDQVTHRFALQLRADGSYRLEPYTEASDFTSFLTALAFHRLKEKHGHH